MYFVIYQQPPFKLGISSFLNKAQSRWFREEHSIVKMSQPVQEVPSWLNSGLQYISTLHFDEIIKKKQLTGRCIWHASANTYVVQSSCITLSPSSSNLYFRYLLHLPSSTFTDIIWFWAQSQIPCATPSVSPKNVPFSQGIVQWKLFYLGHDLGLAGRPVGDTFIPLGVWSDSPPFFNK